jgi:RNA polymerase sigma factor (sigma-70 family)
MAHVLDPPPTLAAPDPVRAALSDPLVLQKNLETARFHLQPLQRFLHVTEYELEAEDLASKAQEIALAKSASFDVKRGAAVTTWIQGIIRNLAMKTLAKRRKSGHIELPDEIVDKADSVLQRLIRDSESEQVCSAIDKLSSSNRKLARLRYFDGMPHIEIAVLFEITEAHVRVKLHRVREELFQLLQAAFQGGQS